MVGLFSIAVFFYRKISTNFVTSIYWLDFMCRIWNYLDTSNTVISNTVPVFDFFHWRFLRSPIISLFLRISRNFLGNLNCFVPIHIFLLLHYENHLKILHPFLCVYVLFSHSYSLYCIILSTQSAFYFITVSVRFLATYGFGFPHSTAFDLPED